MYDYEHIAYFNYVLIVHWVDFGMNEESARE